MIRDHPQRLATEGVPHPEDRCRAVIQVLHRLGQVMHAPIEIGHLETLKRGRL